MLMNSSVSDEVRTTRVFVHLPYGLDLNPYKIRYEQGLEPDASPYGFHHALSHGFNVDFSVSKQRGKAGRFLRNAAQRTLGFDLLHAWSNRKAAGRAAVVWTMLETEALPIAMLMWLRQMPRRHLIGSTVWMINRWPTYVTTRRALLRKLTTYWSVMLVHSKPCLDRARNILPGIHSEIMLFGIAAQTFTKRTSDVGPDGPIKIVAAGNDSTRDWQILLEAFGNDNRFHVVIICSWFDKSLTSRYSNLSTPKVTSFRTLIDIYKDATYIAIPMVENIFSGITVALEAAATGVPLLSSRTGGVPTYLDESEALFVPVGDPTTMRDAVLRQTSLERTNMADRASLRFHQSGYTTEAMMDRYAAITSRLVRERSKL
jgi:glycosyltransferase involved in cell wall biosynthesis